VASGHADERCAEPIGDFRWLKTRYQALRLASDKAD
jgi:hypothetical protein